MIGKKSFILHLDSLDVLDYLDKEQIAELFLAIRDYHVKGIEAVPASLRAVFVPFKNQFDRDLDSYEKKCEANRYNGQKGGRPKKEINPKNPDGFLKSEENQKEPKKADSDNDKDNDSENDNNILLEKESKEKIIKSEIFQESIQVNSEAEERKKVAQKKERFIPPTVQQVQDYCNERQNGIQAYTFVNFYQSKGWKIGNQPMKDWKAAVRTWEQKNKENLANNSSTTQFFNTRPISNDKISGRANLNSPTIRPEFT